MLFSQAGQAPEEPLPIARARVAGDRHRHDRGAGLLDVAPDDVADDEDCAARAVRIGGGIAVGQVDLERDGRAGIHGHVRLEAHAALADVVHVTVEAEAVFPLEAHAAAGVGGDDGGSFVAASVRAHHRRPPLRRKSGRGPMPRWIPDRPAAACRAKTARDGRVEGSDCHSEDR